MDSIFKPHRAGPESQTRDEVPQEQASAWVEALEAMLLIAIGTVLAATLMAFTVVALNTPA